MWIVTRTHLRVHSSEPANICAELLLRIQLSEFATLSKWDDALGDMTRTPMTLAPSLVQSIVVLEWQYMKPW